MREALEDGLTDMVCCRCGRLRQHVGAWLRHHHAGDRCEHVLCPDCRYRLQTIPPDPKRKKAKL
jgi:hypothetical protein